MPTPVKTSESMTKHTTKAEQESRQEAEASVNPARGEIVLTKPSWLKGKGAKYLRDGMLAPYHKVLAKVQKETM